MSKAATALILRQRAFSFTGGRPLDRDPVSHMGARRVSRQLPADCPTPEQRVTASHNNPHPTGPGQIVVRRMLKLVRF